MLIPTATLHCSILLKIHLFLKVTSPLRSSLKLLLLRMIVCNVPIENLVSYPICWYSELEFLQPDLLPLGLLSPSNHPMSLWMSSFEANLYTPEKKLDTVKVCGLLKKAHILSISSNMFPYQNSQNKLKGFSAVMTNLFAWKFAC